MALLGYLCVLHARFAGWVGQRGLAALSVACFTLVVMAWYGVNFILGAGLHSYGFGAGGQGWVYLGVAVNWPLRSGPPEKPPSCHGRGTRPTLPSCRQVQGPPRIRPSSESGRKE